MVFLSHRGSFLSKTQFEDVWIRFHGTGKLHYFKESTRRNVGMFNDKTSRLYASLNVVDYGSREILW